MGIWTAWEIFSAIVSAGVIYRGHETTSFELINNYLFLTQNGSSGITEYSKGGSLYALGLIHANHGTAINEYLVRYLSNTTNDVNYTHYNSIFKNKM